MKDQFNVYGPLDDTYTTAGQTEKAMECFNKAREPNAGDQQAAKAIKKLEAKQSPYFFSLKNLPLFLSIPQSYQHE